MTILQASENSAKLMNEAAVQGLPIAVQTHVRSWKRRVSLSIGWVMRSLVATAAATAATENLARQKQTTSIHTIANPCYDDCAEEDIQRDSQGQPDMPDEPAGSTLSIRTELAQRRPSRSRRPPDTTTNRPSRKHQMVRRRVQLIHLFLITYSFCTLWFSWQDKLDAHINYHMYNLTTSHADPKLIGLTQTLEDW
jgi:hypothetical protein